jgi:hypothetical protein
MTDSTDDPSKATNNKALKASVAASINSTTQSVPTIPTAVHVGARKYTSPTHTQQVMSPTALTREAEMIDTAAEKNQPSGKILVNPLMPTIQFTSLVMTSNLIPREKISHLE